MAWLAGAINVCLIIYVLDVGGAAVKGVYGRTPEFSDYIRSFVNSGGIFALPFITTLIVFLPSLLLSRYFKGRTVS
jgi:hypothetical protein